MKKCRTKRKSNKRKNNQNKKMKETNAIALLQTLKKVENKT